MKPAEILQAFVLSGALGYTTLSMLQDMGAVSSYLSSSESNYRRISFGVIDYVIYLLVNSGVVFLCNGWATGMVGVAVAVGLTAVLVYMYTWLYGRWLLSHSSNRYGYEELTVREQMLSNPYGHGNVQADVFQMSGEYLMSGILSKANVEAGLANDVSLLSLPYGYKANVTQTQAARESNVCYLDTATGLRYYLTYFSEPAQA